MTRLIALPHHKFAVVDDADYELLSQWRWSMHSGGYACRKGASVLMHRFLLGLERGNRAVVDHINGDKLDNRRGNLRVISQHRNSCNRKRPGGQRAGVSRFRGVWFRNDLRPLAKRWGARISVVGVEGKKLAVHLGYFVAEEEAARAYDAVALEWYGPEFAQLNFTPEEARARGPV